MFVSVCERETSSLNDFYMFVCQISTHTILSETVCVCVFLLYFLTNTHAHTHTHTHTHIYERMWYKGFIASSSTGGRQLVPWAADWKAGIPKVSCARHKQTWTTGPDVFSSTRGSSRPDKHKSETVPVRTPKPLSTIWFWAHPRGANPTRFGRTGG